VQIVEVILILFLAVLVYGKYRYQIEVSVAAIAVGLCGDVLEVYTGAMYNIVGRFKDKIKTLVLKMRTKKQIAK
jgi:hypothetical protein